MSLARLLSLGGAEAAMSPALRHSDPVVRHVDCAVGFHIGPAGARVIGTEEEHHDTVIEHRASDEGCEAKSVKRTDGMGNSKTRTKTNCD